MALRIALCGFIVLVVAMGIGRFAFTPQVPLMIRDGQLTLTSAGLVAAYVAAVKDGSFPAPEHCY